MNQFKLQFLAILLAMALCNELRCTRSALVPAMVVFGDSIMDVGNNNHLPTLFKADYLPYGRDFAGHAPTGRFCNGKLAIDFIAEEVQFESYPPPYLNLSHVSSTTIGANFASAASGYDNRTAILNHAIPLSQQLKNYRMYHRSLARVVGTANARAIRNDTLFIVGAGSSDFVLNYYIDPLVNLFQTPSQYSSYLVSLASRFIKDLYRSGARMIGVASLPPLGCLPLVITLFGFGKPECIEAKNDDAMEFNAKMNATIARLQVRLPGLKIVLFDIYTPLYDVIQNPSDKGFIETRRGCYRTGLIETTSWLCNPLVNELNMSIPNEKNYFVPLVFWKLNANNLSGEIPAAFLELVHFGHLRIHDVSRDSLARTQEWQSIYTEVESIF